MIFDVNIIKVSGLLLNLHPQLLLNHRNSGMSAYIDALGISSLNKLNKSLCWK